MTIKTSTVIVGVALSGIAAWLGGCVAQPPPNCQLSTPYWVKYTLKGTATGTCGDSLGEEIGFQKYHPPGTTEFKVAWRPEHIGVLYEEGRVDPNDPNGLKINGFAKITEYPDKATGYCTLSDFVASEQTFEAYDETVDLADGGTRVVTHPELHVKYEWNSLKVLETVNAPGTIFTGEVKYTENTCTATFEAFGIWPPVGCDPALNEGADGGGYNIDCNPLPVTIKDYPDVLADGGLPDGGAPNLTHILGSGINPTFAPEGKPVTCGPSGFCELQLTADEIAKL